jgi:hypothetical protein
MAFIRKKVSTFKWPVSVEEPADGGKFETQAFDAVFRKLGRSEFTALVEKGDVELIEAVLEGWDGVTDEDGKDIPYSKAARTEFLDDPYFTKGVIKAFLATLDGAQAKN